MRLRFVKVTKNNIDRATQLQMSIFPGECAYQHFLTSIRSGKEYWNYYMVFMGDSVVGITGLYSYDKLSDTNTLWLGWFGVLEQYRNHGVGTNILLKTISRAKKFSIKYPEIKYMRLYTSTRDNPIAVKMYRKHFESEEVYNNPKDYDYDGTCLIFSKSLCGNKIVPWKNRYMDLNRIVEDERLGSIEYAQKNRK